MFKTGFISAFILISFSSFKTEKPKDLYQDFKSEQLLVVTTKDWNTIHGNLSTYRWINNKWELVLKNIPIVTGRNGMAWGKGLQDEKFLSGKLKKEGDGRSPAGIFPLTGLFGYGDLEAKMDYLKVDKNTFCVDDPSSVYYNRIVHSDTVKKDWNSAETMRMNSDHYKYGIFVGYNTNPPQPGNGSCIFVHIWGKENSPTAGCTAMTEKNLLQLIAFLDKSKNPILVQAPEKEYKELKTYYKLP